MAKIRTAIIATHPIQYHVPWYRSLSTTPDMEVRVFYGLLPGPDLQGVGFDVPFTWDIPMLGGYDMWVSENSNAKRLKSGLFYLRSRDLEPALRAWDPDAVLITGWNSLYLFQGIRICRKHGIPMIVRGEVNGLKTRPAWVHRCHVSLFRNFDAFLAIGLRNRSYYREHGVSPASIFDAPYFVDNRRFARSAARDRQRSLQLRHRFSIGDGEYCVVFVGKIIRKKRLMDLLRALHLMRRERLSSPRALVVGTGADLSAARAYAEASSLPVSFAGFLNQDQISQAYAVADLVVLPSDATETWGLVVNEAMASGVPALVSDRVGCAADLVLPGRTGYIYRMGDVRELKDRLLQLSHARGLSSAMGRQAQQHIMCHYSVERASSAVLAALRHVRGKRIGQADRLAG